MPICVDNQISELIKDGSIKIGPKVDAESLIQPSSIDLPVQIDKVFQVPGEPDLSDGLSVDEFVNRYGQPVQKNKKRKIQLNRGNGYLAKLNCKLKFPNSLSAVCNPKSTSGRNGLHTKVVCCNRYDEVPEGYRGDLWVFIGPRAFNVRIGKNETLVQMRIVDGERWFIDKQNLIAIDRQSPLTINGTSKFGDDGLLLTLRVSDDMPMAFSRNTGRVLDWEG